MDDPDSVPLLACRDQFEADLARNLLEVEGIPCYLAGRDFDFAELGRAAHSAVFGAEIRVLATDLPRARALLEEAWGRPIDIPGEIPGGARDPGDASGRGEGAL